MVRATFWLIALSSTTSTRRGRRVADRAEQHQRQAIAAQLLDAAGDGDAVDSARARIVDGARVRQRR